MNIEISSVIFEIFIVTEPATIPGPATTPGPVLLLARDTGTNSASLGSMIFMSTMPFAYKFGQFATFVH